ncbi:SRPBCC family protein [Candidatus Nitrospira nitrificans]|uniref:SRPBCC family protein n=1 Tax=Candidatus Nitrospira nitrificans TaxID=1742973 RepID=UPI0015851813|nr:SRPBCC family protein [Candidatus Nitrospira nitrificans]
MSDRRAPASQSLVLWLAVPILLSMSPWEVDARAAADADGLEVKTESGGGIRATAHPLFPAKPEVIQALLADYAHWPDLFEVQMRVAELNIHEGVATIDLRIDHPVMPGERRLVTESRILPSGGLVTDLKGGDFKRYHRVWKLQPAGEGDHTRAEFELIVELDSLVPNWVVAMVTRQELATHFRIVKQKALEHSKR